MTKEEKAVYMRKYRANHPAYRASEVGRVRVRKASKRRIIDVKRQEELELQRAQLKLDRQDEKRHRSLGFNKQMPAPAKIESTHPLAKCPDVDQMYIDWYNEVAARVSKK